MNSASVAALGSPASAFFSVGCPPLSALAEHVRESLPPAIAAVALHHLADPLLPAARLGERTQTGRGDVLAGYDWLRRDAVVRDVVASPYYPHRQRWAAAHETVADWLRDEELHGRLRAGGAVVSRTVEIHPSTGTCSYSCAMCLWSDKRELTYQTKDMRANGLLSPRQWCDVIDELAEAGARALAVSGGGEPLLNPMLPLVLEHARARGLAIDVYTTGFNLTDDRMLAALGSARKVRFSIHSPVATTYAEIVGLPASAEPLRRVVRNTRRLIALRGSRPSPAIGIGFVTLPVNHTQVVEMAAFATSLGVDFLDLRKDEVNVTDALSEEETATLKAQLSRVRDDLLAGRFGRTRIDVADELVGLANGYIPPRSRTSECRAKLFRPAITPYGVLAPCDLKAEPRFADGRYDLGLVTRTSVGQLAARLPRRRIADDCEQCMPSSRTGNAVFEKLLADGKEGVPLSQQPFA